MGQSSSSAKRKNGAKGKSVPLDRDHKDRRSLPRSLRRSSEKISRCGSSSSLGRSTLSQIPPGFHKDDLQDFNPDKDPFHDSTPAKVNQRHAKVISHGAASNASLHFNFDTRNRNSIPIQSVPQTPSKRNSGDLSQQKSPFSPFTNLTGEDLLEATDDNYKSVRDFLIKHYSFDSNHKRIGSRLVDRLRSTPLNGVREPSTFHTQLDSTTNADVMSTSSECIRAALMITREEINELNIIESKLKCLTDQKTSRRGSGGSNAPDGDETLFRVTFRLKNGSDQESFSLSLQKAYGLITERRNFLEKKLELELQHSKSIQDLLKGPNSMTSPPLTSSSSFKSMGPASLLNGSLPKMRKPRALSLVESADGNLGFDGSSYRNLMQDVKDVKTLLFRLQGLLQTVS